MGSKPDWVYRQSAVIPVWGERIVLITSRRNRRWIVPKGIVERGMSPAESAAKEALEEAGVTGRVCPTELGRYEFAKWGGICTVEVFELLVERLHDRWDEMELRDRRLVSPSEALDLIVEEGLRAILRRRFDLGEG